MSGLDLQEALAKTGHKLPVVFLSGHGDIPTTVKVMRRGAEDFITKTAPTEELIEAVNARSLAMPAIDLNAPDGRRCARLLPHSRRANLRCSST